MQSLEKQVKNRFNISDLITKLLRRVLKLEQGGGSGGGGITLPINISDVNTLQPSLDNKIPLSGTTVGNPLTGNIEIGSASDLVFYKETANVLNVIGFSGDNILISSFDVINTANSFDMYISPAGFNATLGSGFLSFSDIGLDINMFSPTAKGISASPGIDYSANLQDSSYPQKYYVDKQHSYSTTETLTGGTWIDAKPIYRKVKLTANSNPAGINTIILSRVAGSYTILEYTKI